MKRIATGLAIWIVLAHGSRSGAQSFADVDVPLEHAAYDILTRFETRVAPGRTFLDARPWTRGEVARLVQLLTEAAAARNWSPSVIEARQLKQLQLEFGSDLPPEIAPPPLPRAFHVWEGTGWRLRTFWQAGTQILNASGGVAAGRTDAALRLEPAAAIVIGSRFTAVQQLSYRVRSSDDALVNTADVRDGEAQYVFDARDRFAITRTVAPYMRLSGGRWRGELGRFRTRWGPGRHNALLLSDFTPPFDLARVRVDLGPVRYTHLAGQLRAARFAGDPPLDERYLAAHRLEWEAHPRLRLALSEALVYGNRGLDLSYLNPLTVLFVTQANNGDLDNALASFDARWIATRGVALYGEGVFDDLNLRRGWRHFGNKVAVLAGMHWAAPFGAADWDWEAEWSWVSQFTYTHVHPIDRYQHFGGALGSRFGPDAEFAVAAVRRQLSRGWSASLFYERVRRGEGRLDVDHDDRLSDAQEFLSGNVETTHAPGVAFRFRGLRSLDVDLEARAVTIRHPGHDVTAGSRSRFAARAATRLEF